jgi:hypothetical protein
MAGIGYAAPLAGFNDPDEFGGVMTGDNLQIDVAGVEEEETSAEQVQKAFVDEISDEQTSCRRMVELCVQLPVGETGSDLYKNHW